MITENLKMDCPQRDSTECEEYHLLAGRPGKGAQTQHRAPYGRNRIHSQYEGSHEACEEERRSCLQEAAFR